MLGDHIRALKKGRWVHAVDLGDQRVLYLLDDPALPPADRLRRVYRPDFTAGSARVETVVHRERTYTAKATVARAWSRFMDPSVLAMFRDSEQFAVWCKIGRLPETSLPAAAAPDSKRAAAAKVRSSAPRAKAPPPKEARKPAKVKARKAKPAARAPAQKVASRSAAVKRRATTAKARKPTARKATKAKKKGRR
jgi:hypothetical protein